MTISLDPTLDERTELLGKRLVVEEVVNPESRSTRLGRVSWSDALLRRSDRRATELNLLEAVDDLVEVEDEVGAVGEEESSVAVESWSGKH